MRGPALRLIPTNKRPVIGLGLLVIVALTTALLPWSRNRTYLRDFEDYGLVIAAAARLEAGQRPYVDFVTPIQSGSLWLNAKAEQWGDGTFQAMTVANGWFIAAGVLGLGAMLIATRRISGPMACAAAWAVVVGSSVQHTIIWYNAVGVAALALVAWGAALAPTLSRRTWGWNALVLAGLVWGGVNKLNFHFVALGVAVAWTVRARFDAAARWRDVGTSLLAWGVAGVVAPLALELAWTGASWGQWRYSVIDLATADRGGYLESLARLDFYLRPMHDYYGPVWLPFAGLLAVAWCGALVALGWRGRSRTDRVFLLGAGVFAAAASTGLLATNHEIVYVSLAATVVMAVALWVGFGLAREGRRATTLLAGPTLLVGVTAWHSAWVGQRSQFGHDGAPRTAYVDAAMRDPVYGYLRGTLIPPAQANSLHWLAQEVRPDAEQENLRQFYGPGAEWLERIWPMSERGGFPLWMSPVSYGEAELRRLAETLAFPSPMKRAIAATAWDHWPEPVRAMLQKYGERREMDQFRIYELNQAAFGSKLPPAEDSIAGVNRFGGNVDPRALHFEGDWLALADAEERSFPGVMQGTGTFRLDRPVMRLQGEVLLVRWGDNDSAGPWRARYEILNAGEADELLWSADLALADGERFATADYGVDAGGRALRFRVSVAPESNHQVKAGWRLPRITHAGPPAPVPPRLRGTELPDEVADPALVQALLTEDSQNDGFTVITRGVHLDAGRVVIKPGGEVWLRHDDATSGAPELRGTVEAVGPADRPEMPIVRVVWSKGGRLEILHQQGLPLDTRRLEVKAWPAEPGGWFGFLFDASATRQEAALRLEPMAR